MKRVVTIQDISCLGKCSITAALPIISAMGIECCVIPTAFLSTHTEFKDFTCRDLTEEILPIANDWQNKGFVFDAVYTGYIASLKQIKAVSEVIDKFKTDNNIIFVDPAMADNGKFYTGLDKAFVNEMSKLCSKADIITPNLTEACLMTETEYDNNGDEKYLNNILIKLSYLGAKNSVITGISYEKEKTGFVCRNNKTGFISSYSHNKISSNYYGTGDIFSSVTVGALMRGNSLYKSLKTASEFVVKCIEITYKNNKANWYGVDFEKAIPYLIKIINI